MLGQLLRSKTLLNAFSSKPRVQLLTIPNAQPFSQRAFERLPHTDHFVPTEKTIDEKMQQLMQSPFAARFEFQRYQGQPLSHLDAVTPQSLHRNHHFEAVHRFTMFDVNRILPNMEAGFVVKVQPDLVDRCHLIVDKQSQHILGAIFFTIDLRNRIAYFQLLEVDKRYQKQHLGKLLIHSALYISLLYHCSRVNLVSMGHTKSFYEKCGFTKTNNNEKGHYELNFLNLNDDNKEQFIESFTSVSPAGDIEQRIEDVRTLHPIDQTYVPTAAAIGAFIQKWDLFNLPSGRFKP